MYLEYQHVKGDYKYVIGYRSNYGSISITPNGEESLYAYIIGGEDLKFNNEATTDEGTKYKLDIGYSKNSRVGVAIDLENQYVMFLSNNKVETYKFTTKRKQNWTFFIRELKPANSVYTDTLSLYLRQFNYDIPFNSNPLGLYYIKSCYYKFVVSHKFIINILFCIIK